MNTENLWNNLKDELKNEIPGHSYRMWIEPLGLRSAENDHVVLSCPNPFSKKRVQDHYAPLISRKLKKLLGFECRLSVEVLTPEMKKERPEKKQNQQLLLPSMNILPCKGRLLRKDFTFDRFVVGGNNNFAYRAALSVASNRDANQNSLFLLSNTGLGKSHLSQAIGHHILSEFPLDRVYYITAEDFTNEMIHAFRTNAIESFKEKYRNNCDVLILEDVHFLSGKDRTQIELAFALDYLFDAEKKIIFSSCYTPIDIPKINNQLRSRLTSALISKIGPPDFETRVRILQKKSEQMNLMIPDDTLQYLAGELIENVRQLESGLKQVAATSSLLRRKADINLAKNVVKNIATQSNRITIDVIKRLVCRHFNITIADIVSRSRKQKIVRPRQMAMYLARRYTDQSLQSIGKSFNRYHATALHSISVVERELKENKAFEKQMAFFYEKIESGDYGKSE